MDAAAWAPESVSWGIDNRTCALRAVLKPGPKAFRIEHRCPGADINPYLAIAAMLAGGLMGIEQGLKAPEPIVGNSATHADLVMLPRTLAEATDLLEGSAIASALLGPELIAQYVAVHRLECQLWADWQRRQISPWELKRYFDMH